LSRNTLWLSSFCPSHGVCEPPAPAIQTDPYRLDAFWCILVNVRSTISPESAVRRSVSLPPEIAEEVNSIADARRVSQNRALVDLIGDGIVAYKQRRAEFFALADRFQQSTDPAEAEGLREELARMTFGG
jgi:hypothetical protein